MMLIVLLGFMAFRCYEICMASSRVGVRIRQLGELPATTPLDFDVKRSDIMGIPNARVLPDPVCDASRKS
jgi:hypothetical protein